MKISRIDYKKTLLGLAAVGLVSALAIIPRNNQPLEGVVIGENGTATFDFGDSARKDAELNYSIIVKNSKGLYDLTMYGSDELRDLSKRINESPSKRVTINSYSIEFQYPFKEDSPHNLSGEMVIVGRTSADSVSLK